MLCLAVLLLSVCLAPVHSANSIECGLLPADFIFLLDSSGSETSTNFQKQVNFMKDFADRFTIGPNETQFSSVTFSTGVRNDFDLKENRNKQELTSAISRIHYMNGETETHLALNYARGHSIQPLFGGRPGVQKYVVVMTDGRSNEPQNTIKYANLLKHQPNVTVIALGIGSQVDMDELRVIATDNHHVFTVKNFDLLHVLDKELTDTTCTLCGDEPADIVFLLDSSGSEGAHNFELQRQFASLVASEFDISRTDTQVGLVTFATTAETEINLQQYNDKPSLLHAIQRVAYMNGETRTDLGLYTIEHTILRHRHHSYGPRPGAKRFVIVLTDGRSNEEALTAHAATSLKKHVDEVFAIGVGNAVDEKELHTIATDDGHHVFTIRSFNELKNLHGNIVSEICEHRVIPTTTAVPTTESTTTPTTTARTTVTTTPTPTTVTTTPTTTTTVKPGDIMTGATCGAGVAHPSGTPDFIFGFCEDCGSKPADIVFVLDSSESEKQENFTKQVNFVYNFSKKFKIGPQNIQFSTVTFSSQVRNDFYLNTYHRRQDVLHAIQHLQYMGAGTNTSLALNFVRENSFEPTHGGRHNATHIVIVITDGQSSVPHDTVHEAGLLKHTVDKVFAIGIGDKLDTNELATISSDNHPLTVGNFDLLHTIQESLENAACHSNF